LVDRIYPLVILAVCLGCRYEHAVRVIHHIGRVLLVDDHDAVAILLIAIPCQRKVEAAGDAELGRIPGAYGKLAGLAVCLLVNVEILDYLGRNSYGTAAHAAKEQEDYGPAPYGKVIVVIKKFEHYFFFRGAHMMV
jgi:hypothetical protein